MYQSVNKILYMAIRNVKMLHIIVIKILCVYVYWPKVKMYIIIFICYINHLILDII